mmetsp:Transcript_99749/g.286514  ORF Transcript_99749/g.286514 Transcript_99749/m.286514 type:complete len:333 (+) Transcript_99749:819-1817(+)
MYRALRSVGAVLRRVDELVVAGAEGDLGVDPLDEGGVGIVARGVLDPHLVARLREVDRGPAKEQQHDARDQARDERGRARTSAQDPLAPDHPLREGPRVDEPLVLRGELMQPFRFGRVGVLGRGVVEQVLLLVAAVCLLRDGRVAAASASLGNLLQLLVPQGRIEVVVEEHEEDVHHACEHRHRDEAQPEIERFHHVLRDAVHVRREHRGDQLPRGVDDEPQGVHGEGHEDRADGPHRVRVRQEDCSVVHIDEEARVARGAESVVVAAAEDLHAGEGRHGHEVQHHGMRDRREQHVEDLGAAHFVVHPARPVELRLAQDDVLGHVLVQAAYR